MLPLALPVAAVIGLSLGLRGRVPVVLTRAFGELLRAVGGFMLFEDHAARRAAPFHPTTAAATTSR